MQQPHEGVILLGFPRSGTTMLRRILGSHPDLCCPPETHVLRACAAFLHEDESPLGFSIGVTTSLRFVGVKEEDVLARVRALGLGLLNDLCTRRGKKIWVEKSALDFFHIDAIDQLLGDRCRYIWVTRNGADVISSMQEYLAGVDFYLPELHDYIRRYPAPPVAFAHAWVDTNARMSALAERRPEQVLTLRYEDLVADPEPQVRRILEFIGVEGDAKAMVESLGQTSGDIGFGDWKTYSKAAVTGESVGRASAMSPRLLNTLGSIINPTLARLGYDEISVPDKILRMNPLRLIQIELNHRHEVAVEQMNAEQAPD